MDYFCTYFDAHYLPRGLTLYASLREHSPAFRLWVLCMDHAAYETLSGMALAGVELIGLDEFEKADPALLQAKRNRSRVEYYFTCTPSLPLFVLNHFPEVDLITYVDADLYFYASPGPIFQEMSGCSIAIIEHRYAPHYREMERCGKYNVGWLSFRRDPHGLACLHWWRERCNEWCYKRLEDGKFADQKYLDDWPSRFARVGVLQHKGANLASWNIENYTVRCENERIWINEEELIFFHFHGFRQLTRTLYGPGYSRTRATQLIRDHIYEPYLLAYLGVCRELEARVGQDARWESAMERKRAPIGATGREVIRRYLSVLYRSFVSGNYVRVPKTHRNGTHDLQCAGAQRK